jgi:hypothetical protein
MVALPRTAGSGDVVECPNCAGHGLRVTLRDGRWSATLAHRVSCPECGEPITLPEGARAGDAITCCGRRYRLSLAFGAFAAEPDGGSAAGQTA